MGEFEACVYIDDCVQTGIRTRTNQACDDGVLVDVMESTTDGCDRSTEDVVIEMSPFGACTQHDDICHRAGEQTQTRQICQGGALIEHAEVRPCMRETDGLSCNDSGGECLNQVCDCPAGRPLRCDGVCVAPHTDVFHCGGCNALCLMGETCTEGTCTGPSSAPCEDLLVPISDPDPEYIFTECPAAISVGACRDLMQDILVRNPAARLCPYQSGAATGDGWCPVRGFAQTCWGYVGTGGDENTACDTGAREFAIAYMRNAQTDEERRACAVVTAVMSHEGGFAPTAKSWDMFCDGGNTGAIGLFQYDFASGLDPLPAGVDAQFDQFFRGTSGPRFDGLASFWMGCDPRIGGATAATMSDYSDIAVPACSEAGAPVDQRVPTELGCRFQGDTPNVDTRSSTRCGTAWLDANSRCGTPCASDEDCNNGERCYAQLEIDVCDESDDCADGLLNSGETDLDCGGPCNACTEGLGCAVGEDCTSGVCTNEVCSAAPSSESSTRCGAHWMDANGRCGTTCTTRGDCEADENCFADLDISVCEG